MKSTTQKSRKAGNDLLPDDSTVPVTEEAHDAQFHANMQLAYLESVIKDWHQHQIIEQPQEKDSPAPPSGPATEQTAPKTRAALRLPGNLEISTIVKSCVALAVALSLGWVPIQRLLATTSAEATVNARVITLRAPIEGDITMANTAADIGTRFENGQEILAIRNPRSDASHLTGLRRERDQLRTTLAALEEKKQLLVSSLDELTAQQERFRIGRVEQLEQRVREVEADIAAAEARHSVAAEALNRAMQLRQTDTVSAAALEKATGDERVARQTIQALTERRKGMLVELDAARRGTYIGDSYNDTPQSAQRKMEVALELADVRARLQGTKDQLETVATEISQEEKRYSALSIAVLRAPVNGRVWEMQTAPGEHVNAGQDLLKLLDCGSAIVTASVSESAYQKLAIGQRATFRPRDSAKELEGWIVGLNGLAAVESNSAIQQSALSREPYHVTLKFPELSRGTDCQIGRSGLVKFDTSRHVDLANIP